MKRALAVALSPLALGAIASTIACAHPTPHHGGHGQHPKPHPSITVSKTAPASSPKPCPPSVGHPKPSAPSPTITTPTAPSSHTTSTTKTVPPTSPSPTKSVPAVRGVKTNPIPTGTSSPPPALANTGPAYIPVLVELVSGLLMVGGGMQYLAVTTARRRRTH